MQIETNPVNGLDPYSGRMPPDETRPLGIDMPDDRVLHFSSLPVVPILQKTYQDIMQTLTAVEPEQGGMLLGPVGEPIVTHFVLDEHGHGTPTSFTLDGVSLNRILRQYLACGIDAKGLVHTHPLGIARPSVGDVDYVRRSLRNARNQGAEAFLLPIVCGTRMYPYFIRRDEPARVYEARLLLI